MITADTIKAALFILVAVFLFGFIFSFLFKVGLSLPMVLGVIYLVKKIF